MSVSISTDISININGEHIKLNLIEAQELYKHLKDIFDNKKIKPDTYEPFDFPRPYYPDLPPKSPTVIDPITWTTPWTPIECLHRKCSSCKGTGRTYSGEPCIHGISCNCARCSSSNFNYYETKIT